MFELSNIFKSIKKTKKLKKTTQSNAKKAADSKPITSKGANLMIIKHSLKGLSNASASNTDNPAATNNPSATTTGKKVTFASDVKTEQTPQMISFGEVKYISKKKRLKLERKEMSRKQLMSLPNKMLMPKCSLCHSKLCIQRGDQCYENSYTASCDYCGREDIHGDVWHCKKCEGKKDGGFDLCRSCGYLISRGRQREIRRVAPPEDDMGLLFNKSGRSRSLTLDGVTIYKEDEIGRELKIGRGRDGKMCPFDCGCCF